MASDEGIEALNGPRDIAASRRALEQAGYKGEKVSADRAHRFPGDQRQ